MTDYLSPGVYVEEMPPLARPITGAGTSTAGFIGLVKNDTIMPVKPDGTSFIVADAGVPQLITGWEEFKKKFGDFQAKKTTAPAWTDDEYNLYRRLQHAVYGFFNNGGTRCYVMRVAADTDLGTNLANELANLAPIDEIAIVSVPGATTDTQHSAIISHCFNLKDRFAVLDGVQSQTVQPPASIALVARSEAGSYSAVYFPWIKVNDPGSNSTLVVPPSGHIAGIYARSDGSRGVHKAPANEVILGALDIECPLSRSDQNGLNPEGINVIRKLDGAITVWGGRTRTDNNHPEWRYISTRRFFNFMRESIESGTRWVVFEPNSYPLWQRVTRTVSDFLLLQWRAGALFGDTPQKAFYVKCDKDTNPSEVREAGQLVTEIGVAIVKPAEFVIFRIQQTTGG